MSRTLDKFDEKYMLKPFGINNLGSSCYFNSVIQSLLSCTSFIKLIKNSRTDVNSVSNPAATEMGVIVAYSIAHKTADKTKKLELEKKLRIVINSFYYRMIRYSKTHNKKINSGQQDTSECLLLILSMLDGVKGLKDLFYHNKRTYIICEKCVGLANTDKVSTGILHMIDTDKKYIKRLDSLDKKLGNAVTLEQQITSVNSATDTNYQCNKCKFKGVEMHRRDQLVYVPEILTVVFKKYKEKKMIPYETEIKFATGNDTTTGYLSYTLVSSIIHSGSTGGGHYWSVCKRDGGWYELNDSNISLSSPTSSPQTYMLLYHFNKKHIN